MTSSTFTHLEDLEDRLLNPHDLFLMKDHCDIGTYLSKLSEVELQEFYSFDKSDALEDINYSITPYPFIFNS
jgi:hypothetical protein